MLVLVGRDHSVAHGCQGSLPGELIFVQRSESEPS